MPVTRISMSKVGPLELPGCMLIVAARGDGMSGMNVAVRLSSATPGLAPRTISIRLADHEARTSRRLRELMIPPESLLAERRRRGKSD